MRTILRSRQGTTLPELLVGAAIAVLIAAGLLGALQMTIKVWQQSSSHTLEEQNARAAFQEIVGFLQGAAPGTLEPTGTTWAANGGAVVSDVTFTGISPIDRSSVSNCRLYWSNDQKAIYIYYPSSALSAYNRTLGLGTITSFGVQRTRNDRTKAGYFERTVKLTMEVQDPKGVSANRKVLSSELLLQTEAYSITY